MPERDDSLAKLELLMLAKDLDPLMHEYLSMIGDWALKVQNQVGLSSEAMCIMLKTAPDAHTAFHAEMNGRRVDAEQNSRTSGTNGTDNQ